MADSTQFHFVIRGLDDKDRALEKVARVSLGLEDPDTSFATALRVSEDFGASPWGTQRTTYDDMIATGSLRLIENADLRTRIIEYYEETDLHRERIDGRRTTYSGTVMRLAPSVWSQPMFSGSVASLEAQAIDSVRTKAFFNLLNAEYSLSNFQRDLAARALAPEIHRSSNR